MVVEQAGGGDGHCPAAAEGAEVVDGGSAQAEVGGGSDATAVVEGPAERQVETAVTGDGASGGPVLAAADQAAAAEQFAAGGLLQVVDIDRQAPCLNYRAVGPAGFVEGQVAVGHQAATDVIEADAAEVERARAHMQHTAASILERAGGEAQLGVGGFQAAAVVQQAIDGVTGFSAGAECPHLATVGQAGGADVEGRGAFYQATVSERATQPDVDGLPGDLPGVVDIAATQGHAIGGEHGAVAVVELAGVDQHITGLGREPPTRVVEAAERQVKAGFFAVDQTVGAVLHQAAGSEFHASVGRQRTAVLVVDTVGEQGQQTLAGEFSALVIEVAGTLDQQRPATRQLAVAVDQITDQVEGDRAAAGQAAGAVVQGLTAQLNRASAVDGAALAVVQQAADDQGLRTVAGDHAAMAVVELDAVDGQGVIAEQATFVLVVDAVGSDVQRLSGTQGTAAVVQGLRGGGGERAVGNHRAGVGDVLGVEFDVAIGIAGVVGVDAGFDDAVVGQLAVTGQGDAVARGEGLAVVQLAFGLYLERGTGVHRPAGV